MGCGASRAPAEPLTALDLMLRDAVQIAKARSTSGMRSKHSGTGHHSHSINGPSFNGLLMHFGKMRPGFLKIKELFLELQPEPDTNRIKLASLHASAASKLHIEDTRNLDDVIALCEKEGTTELDADQFIVVWTILCFKEPGTAISFPEIKFALDTLEKAFTYFDSSTDGTLEKGELVDALSSGTRKVMTVSSPGKKASRHREKGHYKGAADMLFEVLDLDNSGSITFQEFLVGIVHIVLSDDATAEDEDLAELHRDKDDKEP